MLYGKITLLNTSTSGEITQDDTLEIFIFDDPSLPKELGLNSPVTFDQNPDSRVPMAINIQAYVPTEIIINTPTKGPITIDNGVTVIVRTANGIVTGDVIVNSGKLIVGTAGQVNGNISATDGSIVVRNGGTVRGNIEISSGGALRVGGKGGGVKGNIEITDGGRIMMGDADGGGVIQGSINGKRLRVEMRADSIINGVKIP